MPDSLVPYSGYNAGTVTDDQHQQLWSAWSDGLLPGQSGEALAVYAFQQEGGVEVQPGQMLITGRLLTIEEPTVLQVPATGVARMDVIAAYVDRSQSPWEFGVHVVTGGAGGGRPSLSQSPTGLYEVALRAVSRTAAGAMSLGEDERPSLEKVGRADLYSNPPMWRGYMAADATSNDGGWQLLGSMAQDFAYNGSWSIDGHSSIRRIPQNGIYELRAQCHFDSRSTASTLLGVRICRNPSPNTANGTPLVVNTHARSTNRVSTPHASCTVALNAGDTVGAQKTQIGAGNGLPVYGGREYTFFEITWLRER